MTNKKIIALVFLILTASMWGISFISIKIALRVFPPMNLAFYRYLLAAALLYPIMKKTAPAEKLLKKDFPMMAVAGILGITLYFFFENNGVLRISANTASVIIAFLPIAASAAQAVFYKKSPSWITITGILASIIGVYFVLGADISAKSISGYFYMLGAVASFVAYLLVTKPLFDRYSDITITFYQSLFGSLAFLPFLFMETVRWDLMTINIAGNFLYLTIFCSALATYFYMYALNNLGVSVCAIFMNLSPVVTFIGSYVIFGETITSLQLFGTLIVIMSVTLVTLKEQQE